MKAENIPPWEEVIMQNEAADDIYIIVSGEVEMVDCDTGKERELLGRLLRVACLEKLEQFVACLKVLGTRRVCCPSC
ncbi:hypothetical protein ACS0TY_034451 [Phlomoides rotata]